MKIFAKEQIYHGDTLTTQRQNISSTDLMERAGTQIFNWLHMRMQGAQVPIHVFCGIGNNGGDGLVIARHLITHGYNVFTYVVNCSDKRSKDFLKNYDRIKNVTKDWPTLLSCKEDFPQIHHDDIIIDAVFGIGLNRAADDWVKALFQHFKNSKAFTLSVDMPSGLYADKVPEDENGVVWANHTISFASPKLVFFLPDTAKYTQQWEVIDIGLDPEFLMTTETEAELIGKYEVLPMYQPREKFAHKGTYGHGLMIGGSYGKIGSVVLSTRAALVSGAGLVTSYIPHCGYNILQTVLPEAMVLTDANEQLITNINFDIDPTVIGFGIGVGTDKKTVSAFEAFLKENKTPLVIDADGINILASKKTLLKLLPEETVLTPHPKELERLIGTWKDDFDKLKKVKAFVKKYNTVLVIKGANTITVFEDKLFVNTTGNPGLATAGSGDVLTGIITGLISQGYDAVIAAIFGVYLHGRSADIALEDFGYQSLIASHVIDYLGEAYIDLFKKPEQPQEQKENEEQQGPNEEMYI
ncbi:NAD(P)H-hydrate dehydratase [Pontimicrobium aquaticum]|uniref:Bifunctional NAD(P)H-hydrate repair enzyme n=1 Tax=Pontimicrobium aquaticum TaxID=2565367 RepID=A0A4U0EQA0_9FLAO|nr:NAD(P)H-hydrate dehydratase [Pontimicrobium aquaticum]TJY33875.1 NAD(P)H-hydrate dehydratase [Pontimicrobium aquaticum]